jgi:hypothetical protein
MPHWHYVACLVFVLVFNKIAPRLPVLEEKDHFLTDLEILAGEVAVAVKDAHSLVRAPALLAANRELTGYPRGQTVAFPDLPSIASPFDIVLMMVGKELLLDFEDQSLQPVHAIEASSRAINNRASPPETQGPRFEPFRANEVSP